jgi:prepilin-type processing-associated H-X9-DG protein
MSTWLDCAATRHSGKSLQAFADGHVELVSQKRTLVLDPPTDMLSGLSGMLCTGSSTVTNGNWTFTTGASTPPYTSYIDMDTTSGTPAPSLRVSYWGGTTSRATFNVPATPAVTDSWIITGDLQFNDGGASYGEFHAFDSAGKKLVYIYFGGYSLPTYDFRLNTYRPYGTGADAAGALITANVKNKFVPFKITVANGKALYEWGSNVVYESAVISGSNWTDVKTIVINGGGGHGFAIRADNLRFGAY